jgi:hypothetical protein
MFALKEEGKYVVLMLVSLIDSVTSEWKGEKKVMFSISAQHSTNSNIRFFQNKINLQFVISSEART